MFTQLSLFDSATSFDTDSFHAVAAGIDVAACQSPFTESDRLEAARIELASERQTDELRPMGDLAQLVLARYDLMIRRREELERRRREQPRKSIRVLSPPSPLTRPAHLRSGVGSGTTRPARVKTARTEYATAACAS